MARNEESESRERGSRALQQPSGGSMGVRQGSGFMSPRELFSASPFQLMRYMSEEMDRMLRGTGGAGGGRMFQPAVEVLQRNNQFIVRAELPGLRRDDIDIEILEDAVILQGEKQLERQEDDQERGLYRSEWTYGRFYREIPLPPGARPADATARFERGVLEITVPVQQDVARPRRLQIEGDDQQGQQRTEGRAGTKTENRGRGDRPEDRGGQEREKQENRGDARGI